MTGELVAALAAEHAAIYGYGVAGAQLTGATQEAARQAEAAHRTRRDALLVRLTADGASAPPAEPAYALPFPVTGPVAAARLGVHLEERAAAVWRRALVATTGPTRRLALDALVDCAVRATRWRRVAGVSPATVALPGTP
ncbi:MAG TPA: ferritin-like domain-containing protein [Micromonosporaceae bacterium]|nr:ferritin-like domain-containing protein [Micromonosporaceae bacterium]